MSNNNEFKKLKELFKSIPESCKPLIRIENGENIPDKNIFSGVASSNPDILKKAKAMGLCARLTRYGISGGNNGYELRVLKFSVRSGTLFKHPLHPAHPTLSVVGFETDTREIADLRDFLYNGHIVWEVPDGNWEVHQYICASNKEILDVFDKNACLKFFGEIFPDTSFADEIELRDIYFNAPNRRNWPLEINKRFYEKYKLDPAPYYPVLFADAGEHTQGLRDMFYSCRAEMLAEGLLTAGEEFAAGRNIKFIYSPTEGKTSSPGWLFGDSVKLHSHSSNPSVILENDYCYAHNSMYPAAAAVKLYGKKGIAEVCSSYSYIDEMILYRDVMNSCAKGFSRLTLNIPPDLRGEKLKRAADFSSRCSLLAREGEYSYDIAVIYPINSMNSYITFYEREEDNFTYPETPNGADYMNILNSLSNYCGVNALLIHPDEVERISVSGKNLYYSAGGHTSEFKALFLPGMTIAPPDVLKKAKEFFDGGGVVFASSELPFKSSAKGEDTYIEQLVRSVFGLDDTYKYSFDEYFLSRSAKGGRAYFIPSSQTASDGTCLISHDILHSLLMESGVDLSVIIENMPRVINRGVLNLTYPVFKSLKVSDSNAVGGFFNHMLRDIGGNKVFYISNTTNTDFSGRVSLRGRLANLEKWDPLSGVQQKQHSRYEHGRTVLELSLKSGESMFFIGEKSNK